MHLPSHCAPRTGLAIAIWAAIIGPGCLNTGPVSAPLKVQVFIPTEGGDNVTLGLVPVAAAPLDRIADTISAHYRRVDEELALERDKLNKLQEEQAKAEAIIEQCREDVRAGRAAIAVQEAVLTRAQSNPFEWPEYLQAIRSVRKAIVAKRDEKDALAVQLRSDGKDDDAAQAKEASTLLNNTVREMGELVAGQIVGHDVATRRQLVREHIVFYSRGVFQECADRQKEILVELEKIRVFLDNLFEMEQDAAAEKHRLEPVVRAALARLNEADATKQVAIEQRRGIQEYMTAISSRENLFESLRDAAFTKQTDPNGVVTFELDTRLRWVLWATTHRLLPRDGEREQYFWIVEAPPAREWNTTSPFFLSTHNRLNGRPAITK